jgi:hypothetical protein
VVCQNQFDSSEKAWRKVGHRGVRFALSVIAVLKHTLGWIEELIRYPVHSGLGSWACVAYWLGQQSCAVGTAAYCLGVTHSYLCDF